MGNFTAADYRDLNYTKYVQEDGPKLVEDEL
jgi:hypothetical protein